MTTPQQLILGLGGAGINTINYIATQHPTATLAVAETDKTCLEKASISCKIQLGNAKIGTGGNLEQGQKLAQDSQDELRTLLAGHDVVFVVAGVGGGTGGGASPVVARLATEMGIACVVIAIMPFIFEGRRHLTNAKQALENLQTVTQEIIVLSNDDLVKKYGSLSMDQSFSKYDELVWHKINEWLDTH